MTDIREYAEGMGVEIIEMNGRKIIHAKNQGGYDSTFVDLEDVIEWAKANGDYN